VLSDLDITIITGIAGCISACITNPIWFVNTRMAISKDKKSIPETIKQIYNEEGI